ncbi:MAG: hypothetical protein QOI57_226 [Rubrobacteraceae bacterium]|jgi:hypothetical protein|nr:hypothetical protein [Rubrobacteraceae bacterium]
MLMPPSLRMELLNPTVCSYNSYHARLSGWLDIEQVDNYEG